MALNYGFNEFLTPPSLALSHSLSHTLACTPRRTHAHTHKTAGWHNYVDYDDDQSLQRKRGSITLVISSVLYSLYLNRRLEIRSADKH